MKIQTIKGILGFITVAHLGAQAYEVVELTPEDINDELYRDHQRE